MVDSPLPEPVRRFILRHIQTIEQLEILLLLLESAPRAWADHEIASTLRTTADSARTRLSRLHSDGLIALSADQTPRYLYRPRTDTLAAGVRALAACYRERRVAVITQIFSPGSQRALLFADAFKIKKGDS